MEIKRATVEDINDIVDIHCDAFKGFFLTSLGRDFLKFYYTCFVESADAVSMCAFDNGKLLGFSAATKVCKGFNSKLIKENFLYFCSLSFKLLFTNPSSLIRLVKNITKKSDSVDDEEDYAELYSIGVSKYAQGKGIGKQLLFETERVMKDEGVQRISLTTDYYNNDATVGFYLSMGYKVLYEFTAYPNRKMYRFIKTI